SSPASLSFRHGPQKPSPFGSSTPTPSTYGPSALTSASNLPKNAAAKPPCFPSSANSSIARSLPPTSARPPSSASSRIPSPLCSSTKPTPSSRATTNSAASSTPATPQTPPSSGASHNRPTVRHPTSTPPLSHSEWERGRGRGLFRAV